MATDQRLRLLLRAGRKAGGLSQQEAAALAGISRVYWQKIESGAQLAVPADTLATMFAGVRISAGQLRAEGYDELAAARDNLAAAAAAPAADAEEHLAATPGASDDEISALQAVWRALRAGRTAEPYAGEFRRTSRQQPDLPAINLAW